MSIEHVAVVLHHSRAKGTAKLVLIGIANHEGDGGSYPTHATLAKYANVDESNVRKAIRQLRSWGEVAVYVQEGGDRDCPDERRPNRYEVLVCCPPWCDRSPNHRDTRKLAGRQGQLWKTGGANTPTVGAFARGGWAPAPRGGGAPPPPKPSIPTNQPEVVGQPQTARARLNASPCRECSQGEYDCQRRQRAWRPDDRHPYVPTHG